MEENKKKVTKKKIINEIFVGLMILSMFTGGYFLKRKTDYNKEYEQSLNDSFYYGCNNLIDSVKRVYDAGGREYVNPNYEEIPKEMKEEYIKKNGLEGKLK